MDTLTYIILLAVLLTVGTFIFLRFETPHESIKKGLRKIKNIKFLKVNGKNTPLTLPGINPKVDKGLDKDDIRIYIHNH